jgi:hypothetical protein
LTATVVPAASAPCVAASTARCTCETDADATGCGENSRNSSPIGLPNSSTSMASATDGGNGGTRSWSRSSDARNSGGNRSGRVEKICPILMNVAPSRWNRSVVDSPSAPVQLPRRMRKIGSERIATVSQTRIWISRMISRPSQTIRFVGRPTRSISRTLDLDEGTPEAGSLSEKARPPASRPAHFLRCFAKKAVSRCHACFDAASS